MSLLGLKDDDVLTKIGKNCTGFRRATDADYDPVRRKMEKAKEFRPGVF